MGKFFKIAMFITSFLPLWITVVFIDILNIKKGDENLYTEKIGLGAIALMLFFSCFIILGSIKKVKKPDYQPYKVVNATQEKGITSEFLLSYILPLFAFNFTLWESVAQFLIYFLVLAFLCIRNNNVYANLLFECMGYKFYNCELVWAPEPTTPHIDVVVLSKANLCANKGNSIEVATLNKPFYIMKHL